MEKIKAKLTDFLDTAVDVVNKLNNDIPLTTAKEEVLSDFIEEFIDLFY